MLSMPDSMRIFQQIFQSQNKNKQKGKLNIFKKKTVRTESVKKYFNSKLNFPN